MKSEIIGYDGVRPQVNPNEGRPERRKLLSKRYGYKNATHKDFLDHIRTKRYAREVHSDGFLAISDPARECECGGACIAIDGYICPRCGKQN